MVSMIRSIVRKLHSIFTMHCSLSAPFFYLTWTRPSVNDMKINCDVSLNDLIDFAGFDCLIQNSDSCWVKRCSGHLASSCVLYIGIHATWMELLLVWKCGFWEVIYETNCLDVFLLIQKRHYIKLIQQQNLVKKFRNISG
ncbi:hypothetical protein AHAS_Ahas15G0187900 [Arachis hypogaea]